MWYHGLAWPDSLFSLLDGQKYHWSWHWHNANTAAAPEAESPSKARKQTQHKLLQTSSSIACERMIIPALFNAAAGQTKTTLPLSDFSSAVCLFPLLLLFVEELSMHWQPNTDVILRIEKILSLAVLKIQCSGAHRFQVSPTYAGTDWTCRRQTLWNGIYFCQN